MLLQKKNYFNLRPAVLITAGLIFGILLGGMRANSLMWLSFSLFLLLALTLLIISAFCFYKDKKFYVVIFAICLILLILGLFLIDIDLNSVNRSIGKGSFVGYAHEIYSENFIDCRYYYSLVVKGDFLGNQNALCYLNITSLERLYYGSEISFTANFNLLDKPYSYDVFYFADDVAIIKIGDLNGLIAVLRSKLLLALENHAGDNYGLTYALLTGDTCYVLDSVLYKYQVIGVAHLFAVSGLHIGLMYGVLLTVLKLIKVKGEFRFITVVFILICYVGFCGFSPSSIRAFIIVTVREIAFLTGRKPDGTTNLSISAFIVLLINPTDLFTASFLLSFSVYLGLILLATPLSKYLSNYLPKTLSKLLSASVVAELVATPILLDLFGSFSIFSFLFNMALIPFISFLYPLIFLSSILLAIFNAPIFAIVPEITFMITEFLLNHANVELFTITRLKFGVSSVPYYLFLYSFANKFNFKVKTYVILRIIIIIITVLAFCIVNT